ncbi:MAG: hypothetical protein ABSE27_00100 [Acidobacteriaceae bacterium]
MSDSVVLVCAVFASLASGVLLAYGVCQAVFALFRMSARPAPAPSQARVAASASIVEG